MHPTLIPTASLWRRTAFLVLSAMILLGSAGLLPAANSARKLLKLDISQDRKTAVVQVPAGYSEVVLQRFSRDGGWKKIATRKADASQLKFKLPAAGKDIRWRAIGRFQADLVSRGKFPAAFYQGKNAFGPLKNSQGGVNARVNRFGELATGGVAGDAPAVGAVPEEADIWKVDGNTVYFFNQLRGLQVLDVTNPADPRLTASLRLAAVGEDLYLLPGSGSARHLILLTQVSNKDGSFTRINLVKVEAGNIEITHRQDVPGYLSDSRLIGNRLVLATNEWGGGMVTVDGVDTETSTSHLSQWLITPGQAPQDAGEFVLEGDSPIISAGADWLAVAVTPTGEWGFSDVSVFGLEPTGLVRLTPKPIRTVGSVADKFKMQWKDNVLTTITEKYSNESDWTPTTVLENFRVWGAGVIHPMIFEDIHLGSLKLASGESLYATRFAGDKAYIVTFLQTDPLWVVDLSNPKKPAIAGSIEVPGWSSHLEPIGDDLLAIGWESNTVAASLFDVANPAAPKLLRRITLGAPGSYSEAAWDEQALKVLPEAGLAMIPLTSYDETSGASTSVVQLLDLDLKGGDLIPRGTITHAFDARRADLLGNAVVSISQRVLVTADIEDRDKPAVLAEVSLAWPVDRVLDAGKNLIQIENGSAYGYGRATARISASDAPESVVAEIDLGDGSVRGADLRDGKLYILREIASSQPWYFRSPVVGELPGKLFLDVYDATALPSLPLTGSVSTRVKNGTQVSGNGLLWPQANRPAVVLDAVSNFWRGWDFPILIDTPITLQTATKAAIVKPAIAVVDRFPFWRPRKAPRVLVFDTTDPAAPTVGEPVTVGTVETIPNGVVEAADGWIVLGASNWKNESNGEVFAVGQALESAHIVEVPASGDPVVRPGIDLPGELFAVSDLDHEGFLAFTRNADTTDGPAVKVNACDGIDAFEIAGLDEDPDLIATAGGRRLFVAKKGGVERHLLKNDGTFTTESKLEIGWKPQQLRWTGDTLLGSKWNALFAADGDAVSKWRFPTWSISLENVSVASDGDLLVPFGDYGAERLSR